jgi:hypothetical protein
MRSIMCLLFIGFLCSSAMAGEIFGTIIENGKTVPDKVKVEVTVAGKVYAGETDKLGTYHVFVAEKGKGTCVVYYNNQKPSADVFSFDKATRYDWTIESVDGKPVLKRK